MKALWCYVEVDLYASFELHTEQTIMAGREWVAQFYELMKVSLADPPPQTPDLCLQEYMALEISNSDGGATKNWDFPKMHSLVHLFDEIVAKGVTRNYNTKPNESRHRPLKRIYLLLTNFKDVAEQVGSFGHK